MCTGNKDTCKYTFTPAIQSAQVMKIFAHKHLHQQYSVCTGNENTCTLPTYTFTPAIQCAQVIKSPPHTHLHQQYSMLMCSWYLHISVIYSEKFECVCMCVCVHIKLIYAFHCGYKSTALYCLYFGKQWNSLWMLITITSLFKRDIAMLKCTEQSKPLCGHIYRPTHQTWVWWEQHSGWSHSAHQSMPDHSCTASKQRVSNTVFYTQSTIPVISGQMQTEK